MNRMNGQAVLRVAYAADDHYAKFLGISLLSLLEHNTAFAKTECYVMDCGISETNRQRLQEIAGRYACRLSFVSVENIVQRLSLQGAAFTIAVAAYARLFLPSLLPDVDTLLYLDCDTVVADSLEALWNTPLGDN